MKLISSFAVEYIPNKIKEFINKFPGKKNIKTFFEYKKTIQLCVDTFA